jgi:hypothetical protein
MHRKEYEINPICLDKMALVYFIIAGENFNEEKNFNRQYKCIRVSMSGFFFSAE